MHQWATYWGGLSVSLIHLNILTQLDGHAPEEIVRSTFLQHLVDDSGQLFHFW